MSVSKQQLEAISLQVCVDRQSASRDDGAAPETNTAKLLSPARTCGRLQVSPGAEREPLQQRSDSSDQSSDCCCVTVSSKCTDLLLDVPFV